MLSVIFSCKTNGSTSVYTIEYLRKNISLGRKKEIHKYFKPFVLSLFSYFRINSTAWNDFVVRILKEKCIVLGTVYYYMHIWFLNYDTETQVEGGLQFIVHMLFTILRSSQALIFIYCRIYCWNLRLQILYYSYMDSSTILPSVSYILWPFPSLFFPRHSSIVFALHDVQLRKRQ